MLFPAQQTAERALKAYLFHQGEELIFTHSIFRLCDLATPYDSAFQDMREHVKLLDFYYVEARYPNALEEVIPAEFYSDRDAEQAIAMARIVIESVQARMTWNLARKSKEMRATTGGSEKMARDAKILIAAERMRDRSIEFCPVYIIEAGLPWGMRLVEDGSAVPLAAWAFLMQD